MQGIESKIDTLANKEEPIAEHTGDINAEQVMKLINKLQHELNLKANASDLENILAQLLLKADKS